MDDNSKATIPQKNLNIDAFVTVFRSQFQVGADSISAETEYRKLEEWSSMQSLFIIAVVDEHFGHALKEKDFRDSITVADLFNKICGAQNRKE